MTKHARVPGNLKRVIMTLAAGLFVAMAHAQTCTPAPPEIISWWPAEGNADDVMGTNNGILLGGLSFTNGEVGQGFWFNNTNQGVDISSNSSLRLGESMTPSGPEEYASCTFECWINPADVSQSHPIFEWPGLELSIESGGTLTARMQTDSIYIGEGYGEYFLVTNTVSAQPGLVVANAFQHVAVVFIQQLNPNAPEGLNYRVYLYYNGIQVGSMLESSSYVWLELPDGPSGDVHLGYSPTEGIDFAGILDEATLYSTNLSGDQIAAIYNAGPEGKCSALPTIVSEPTNEVVAPAGEADLSVTPATGEAYSYQWQFDGTNLPSTGTISTVASTGSFATCVAVDKSGNLFFSGSTTYAVTELATSGVLTTIAGTGTNGYSGDGGMATNASMGVIKGVAADSAGDLFIADSTPGTIRKVDANGVITTFAGSGSIGYSGDGGAATSAQLSVPSGVAVDAFGNVFIADSANNVIRKVDTNGIITTFAGNGTSGFWGDGGPATNAELAGPTGVAVDSMGRVFISDNVNLRVRKVDTNGIISTFAGGGTNSGTDGLGDGGPATGAQFASNPVAVAVDNFGNLFIVDPIGSRIREVFAGSDIILTVAGTGLDARLGYSQGKGDGGPATAGRLGRPAGVAADNAGNLYIADGWDACIRKVSGLPPYPPNYSTYIVRNASGADAGTYSVVITTLNTGLSVASTIVTLTVALPPVINGIAQNSDGSFSLNLATTTNVNSRVFAATNLCPPIVWQPIYTNSTGGAWQFIDTNTGGIACKYYRLSTP